jgi:competence protein ComEC
MADAEEAVENLWKSKDESKRIEWAEVDILKVGHHGSKTSSTQEFLERISPKIAIISVSSDNPYGHPSKTVIERLKEITKEDNIYRTDRDGTIYIEQIKNEIKIIKLKTNLNGN